MSNQQKLTMGRFGAPHGVRGQIKVISFTSPIENLATYSPWYIRRNNQWEPIKVANCKPHGKNLVANVQGIDDRDVVAAFTNCDIAIDREALPELADECYWSDLTGLDVQNEKGETLGKIDSLFETGANDVIVVKDKEKIEILIPYIDDVVKKVDLEKSIMIVDWDPEL